MTANAWLDPTDNVELAQRYARHGDTLRGTLRHALVTRALLTHLPPAARLLDIGGGAAVQARELARAGHHVTVLDPDPAMLAQARDALDREPAELQQRIKLVQGVGEDAPDLVGSGFDGVLCHGVLLYVDDPDPLLGAVVAAARPGGLVSVLAKNAAALAMRPGIEGRYHDAISVLDTDTDTETNLLGATSRADDRDHIIGLLATHHAEVTSWYGVRVLTDHLRDAPVPPDFDTILELEWRAGARDPYRHVARLFHLLAVVSRP